MTTDNSESVNHSNGGSNTGPDIELNKQNLDATILAEQKAKSNLIRKISFICMGFVFGAFAIYQIGYFIGQVAFAPASEGIEATNSQESVDPPSTDILSIARDELQQMLAIAESAVADIEQDVGRNNWNNLGISALRNSLQLAYGSYSAEDYQQAGRQLAQLKTAVAEFEHQYQQQWQAAFAQAQTAWQQQDIVEARLQNQTVLNFNPDHLPARELQERLNVWQQVQDKLEALRVAEVENNALKQQQIAQEIIDIDPQNMLVAQKLQKLETQLQEQAFAQAIASARNLLSDGDITGSKSALAKASAIYPGRSEIEQIQQQLDNISSHTSAARFEQQIATMQSVDNWAATLKISETAKTKHPEHAQFELSYKLASQILKYEQQLNAYLGSPARLTDTNIRNNANRLLAQVAELEVASASLKFRADELRSALSDSLNKMPVTVRSDGRTDIRVLGTGNVGKTKQKVIQLLPGNYRFEGKREGYQTKIISFTVSASGEAQSITLICDQKI